MLHAASHNSMAASSLNSPNDGYSSQVFIMSVRVVVFNLVRVFFDFLQQGKHSFHLCRSKSKTKYELAEIKALGHVL